MSYRFTTPAPVYFDIPGKTPLAYGSWTFYAKGTTTPKDTWSNEGKTVLNSNPVQLDSSGRLNTDVWLDGDYTAVLKDQFGATQTTKDITSGVPAGLTIPALAPGFLTNDLSNLLWQTIRQVPDPTGSVNYILSTDGSNLIWIPQPAAPTPPAPVVVIGTGMTYFAQGTTAYAIQSGTATAPNVGGRTTTQSVVYPTAFLPGTGMAVITPTGSIYSPNGNQPSWTLTSSSTTGFTVKFTMGELDDSNAGWNFNATVPFNWLAFGTITTPT